MPGSNFDPKRFFHRPENVALYVPADELFGLLKRSLDLPAQWAALTARSAGDHVVTPPGGIVEGADAEDILFVRTTPFDIELSEEGIVTKDRLGCRTDLRLRLSIIPERTELLSFRKSVVASHRVVQTKSLAQFLGPTLRTALSQFAAGCDAADLVDGSSTEALTAALTESLQAPLFTAGMMLEATPSAKFDSKTLKQVRESQRDAAKRRAEHEAAHQVQQALQRAQSDRMDHLSALLTRLGEMAAASPDVDLPDLVRTFSERERGEVYEALFASEPAASTTRWIVVAAGDELLFFDPASMESPARRLTITGDAGPVRSIHPRGDGAGTVLLLGAATGVYRLPIERAEPDVTLLVPGDPQVKGGFNAAALIGDRVFASHSEIGLCEWDVHQPFEPKMRFESMTRDAKAVRAVQFFDGHVYCAIDDRIIRFSADELSDRPTTIFTGSGTTITALVPTPKGLYAGNSGGDVLHWADGRETAPDRLHTGTQRAAESLWLLTTHGVRRLVYSDTSLQVHARVLGDNFTCHYEAGGQTLRRVEVAPDLLVATNDLRDRLICWSPGQPAKPSATIAVSRLCGRSVQDVCLVS